MKFYVNFVSWKSTALIVITPVCFASPKKQLQNQFRLTMPLGRVFSFHEDIKVLLGLCTVELMIFKVYYAQTLPPARLFLAERKDFEQHFYRLPIFESSEHYRHPGQIYFWVSLKPDNLINFEIFWNGSSKLFNIRHNYFENFGTA